MRTILIPLDGSKLGEAALVHGLEHYSRDDTRVILLRCTDLNYLYFNAPMLPRDFSELDEAERTSSQAYLDEQVALLKERGYEARCLIARGEASERILAVAEAQKVDQILLTTHGRTGPARLLLGSVAESVIRHSHVPVLVMPSPDRQGHSQASFQPEKGLPESCRAFMEGH